MTQHDRHNLVGQPYWSPPTDHNPDHVGRHSLRESWHIRWITFRTKAFQAQAFKFNLAGGAFK